MNRAQFIFNVEGSFVLDGNKCFEWKLLSVDGLCERDQFGKASCQPFLKLYFTNNKMQAISTKQVSDAQVAVHAKHQQEQRRAQQEQIENQTTFDHQHQSHAIGKQGN